MQTSMLHRGSCKGQLSQRRLQKGVLCLPAQPVIKRHSTLGARMVVSKANQKDGQSGSSMFPLRMGDVIPGLRSNSTLMYFAQTLDLLAFLALIDAAYSGDWSRIGVITKAQEAMLQNVAVVAIAAHALCAVLAAKSAEALGMNVVVAALKGFFSGAAGLFEYTLPKED